MPENALALLHERGFVQNVSDADGLRAALDRPIVFYLGVDPSASSLTVGHLVPIMLATHLQRAGHHAIFVAGGGTGLIGDPTDRAEVRALLTEEEIEANLAGIRAQLDRLVDSDGGRTEIVNNFDWLRQLGYLEFLRDIGRHFSLNEMLATETYRARLDAGKSLNFIEINYRPMQAYDFLHLFRTRGCRLQIGGSDQWANILAGVDLIRRSEGAEAYGLVAPLLTTNSGEKMGKTAAGALWLDAERTAPFDFYQYWINVEDARVPDVLGVLTLLPMARVRELGALRGPAVREAKEALAYEITAIVHGADAALEARETSRALFAGSGDRSEAISETMLAAAELEAGIMVVDALVSSGLAASRGAARRLVAQGGAYINEERVASPDAVIGTSDLRDGTLLLRAGKKRYHRLRLARG